MSIFDPDTSTDELAASLGLRYPSPARARPAFSQDYRVSTPLAQRSPNVRRQKQLNLDVTPSLLRGASPAKSMFFDPDPEHGGADSPWRIKVTVQAEPRNGSSPAKSPAPRTRVTRIPLKDADSSPAKSKPGRKRKSDVDSAIKKRKGTPLRRRSGRVSDVRKSVELEHELESTPAPQEPPVKKRRGRPRKSTLSEMSVSVEPEREEAPDEIDEETEDKLADVAPAPQYNDEGDAAFQDDQPADDNFPEQEPADDGPHDDDDRENDDEDGTEVGEEHLEEAEYDSELEHDPIEDEHAEEDLPPNMEQFDDDDEDDVDFVQLKTYPERQLAANKTSQAPNQPKAETRQPAVNRLGIPLDPPRPQKMPEPVHITPIGPFDFSKLTPLHVKQPIPPPKERTPPARKPRVSYPVTELYAKDFGYQWQGAFSPLPKRSSPARSPAPFSKRNSSPATEEDADMWRSMVAQPQRRSTGPGSRVVKRQSMTQDEYDSDPESEIDAPEATSRTIGDATMMQSEDFSMVSLSSLPSAKDINSSLLGQSEGAQSRSYLDRSEISSRKPSRLQKAVTFSSPLAQSVHSLRDPSTSESDSDDELSYSLPQERTPQKSSSHQPQQSMDDILRSAHEKALQNSRLTTPPKQPKAAIRRDFPVSHTPVVRAQQTPVTEPARLPTPNSGENQTSPPPRDERLQSDISYPEVDEDFDQQVQDTPAKSEAEMSTPPATPPERHESPSVKRAREVSLASSGGSTKISWVDEPKSARMIALENKWQEDRDNVMRTIAQAKRPAIRIESDAESSESEGEPDKEEQDEEEQNEDQQDDTDEAPAPITALAPTADQTADIWQDISASFDDGDALTHPRRQRPTYTRPTHLDRPSKVARTDSRQSPGAATVFHTGQATTPQKSYGAEQNMASVQRRAKTKADVSALFGRVAGSMEPKAPAFNMQTKTVSPAKPSPLRHAYLDGTVDETDMSALSDVRQIRNEMKSAAQKRPPFPLAPRGTTVMVPTKLKSIDDTLTTQGDDDEVDLDVQDQSVISFTGQRQPSRSLFSGQSAGVHSEAIRQPGLQQLVPTGDASMATDSGAGVLSYIWRTLTFSHPYIPPPRPGHDTLFSAEDKYPLLPSVWAWSHTHWQTLDDLYQYYKRKPSRFSPSRTARPDNTDLMTPQWSRFVDITLDHWGYRVRLEDTHIVLAILFMQLLVLPSEREYAKVYGKDLEYRVHQNRAERPGQRITEWDVLKHLFAIVAGEMLREDEAVGRKVRRDLVEFKYKLKGQEWRHVHDVPGF